MTNPSYPSLAHYNIPDLPEAAALGIYLKRMDEARWYSNFGPLVKEFERRLQAHLSALDKVGASQPITLTTLTTCYHALAIGLQVFHLPREARVLMPSVTFPACALAVRHAGAEPVFADVSSESWMLTPAVARKVASVMPIHAVMPVAVYGVPVPVQEWDQFMKDTGIPVIIDAAAALDVQQIPAQALVAFSMHATKPFGIGEGGVLAGRNPQWIEEARLASNFGMRDRIAIHDGSNAKMSEYHAAVALAQFDRWDNVKQRRHQAYALYRDAIKKSGLGMKFQPNVDKGMVGCLMLQLDAPRAADVIMGLNARNIMAHKTYLPPLYHHPYFENVTVVNESGAAVRGMETLAVKARCVRNSEGMLQSVFGLPFHAFLKQSDIDYVMEALAAVLKTRTAPQKKLVTG